MKLGMLGKELDPLILEKISNFVKQNQLSIRKTSGMIGLDKKTWRRILTNKRASPESYEKIKFFASRVEAEIIKVGQFNPQLVQTI